jgi:hypothetical protein
MPRKQIQRRTFLKAAGISVALPALESMCFAADSEVAANSEATGDSEAVAPRRLVCIGNEFGMYPEDFWPKDSRADYAVTKLLKPLEKHRDDFTLFSHLDHGLKGGHFAIHAFLTGVKYMDAKGMADGGISLDQRCAEQVGSRTRFPSLTIGSEGGLHGGCQMSWTRTGTRIPPVPGPRELFKKLFIDENATAKKQATNRLDLQASILDAVLGDAKSLEKRVSKADRVKLDEYLSAVREVEVKLKLDRRWQNVAKPTTDLEQPENEGLARDLPRIYDLLALALQTDSTRVATLEVGGSFAASDIGILKGYHGLSHHGKVQGSIDLLTQIELYQVEQFARFVETLRSIREPNTDGSLLDRTQVLFGSGMGNANSHTNSDLPVILAGGGFKHGEHKVYPRDQRTRVPLCNLYLSMLQRFGVEVDRFSTATRTLTGLETA